MQKAGKRIKREERIRRYIDKKLECIEDGLLPHFFYGHIAATEQQTPALKQAIYTDACMWIYGQTGRGKSYLARLIIQDHLSWGKRCAFETAENLFGLEKLYEKRKYIPVLCIDDIDKANYSEFVAAMLHDCLTFREQAKLQTIVTCEYDIKTFCEKLIEKTNGAYGQSTLQRLNACGQRVDFHMEGENLRSKGYSS